MGGCGSSKPCTKEEEQVVFSWACREMLTLCIQAAVTKLGDIKVFAPADDARKLITTLRAEAAKAGDDAGPPAEGKRASEKSGGGGFMGGMLDKAKKAADKAQDMVEAGAAKVTKAVLTNLASALEDALAKLDQPFTECAQEVVGHKEEVLKAYASIISGADLENAKDLLKAKVRRLTGGAGGVQMETRDDSCSVYLTRFSLKMLCASLMSTTALDDIKTHHVTKAWAGFVDTYNEANAKLGCNEMTKKLQQAPIEMDVNRYIAEQTILQLAEIMGKEEGILRANPTQKSSKCAPGKPCDTFAYCFGGGNLAAVPIAYFEDVTPNKDKQNE